MAITPKQWEEVKALFEGALLEEPEKRASFLTRASAPEEVRQQVENLLARHVEVDDFLDSSPLSAASIPTPGQILSELSQSMESGSHNSASAEQSAAGVAPARKMSSVEDERLEAEDLMVGRRVGAYRLIKRVGYGGMAAVYFAVRDDDQYQKQVAVKLIRPDLDSAELLARFRTERQTLAALDHPNIVRLLDGGSAEEGLPYLVMEHVEGVPIDAYCDEQNLSIELRLRLFCKVCAAVEHAHRKLVIHRDLKPSNILVTTDGTPKLLDFGIAKMLHPEHSAQRLLVTQTNMRRMTPAYASPEQVRGEQVTPASDIYSLGVVLYELLTGHRPYRLKQPTPAEIERAICEQEPENPSTAVDRIITETAADGTTVSKTPEFVSRTREGQPEKLRRRLRGDLDTIVLTALCKEAPRRYASVEEFSADIQRHLGHLPIKARRSTLAYLASRFALRHKTEIVAAAMMLFVLLTAIGYTVWEQHRAMQLARAELAAQRSRGRHSLAVLGFRNLSARPDTAWLSTALSEMLTTELAAGGKLRTIPGESVAQIKISLSLPETDSLSRETLGHVYKILGSDFVILGSYLDMGDASRKVRLDLRVQDAALGETVASLAETGSETALPDLVTRAGAALRERLAIPGISPSEAAQVQASLPANPEAARLYAEGLAKLRVFDALGARDLLQKAVTAAPDYAMAHSALADAQSALGYDANAQTEAKKAFDLAGSLPREQSLWIEGRYYQATRKWDKAIDVYRTLFNFFPDNLEHGLSLASVQTSAGMGSDALSTIASLRNLPLPIRDDPRIDLAEANAARAVSDFKREQSAASVAVEKGERRGSRLLVAQARVAQGRAFRDLGDPEKAKRASNEARQLFVAVGDRLGEALVLRNLGAVLMDQGDLDGAKKAFQDALQIHREIGNKSGEAAGLSSLARILTPQKQIPEARQALERSMVLSREMGDEAAVGIALRNIGNLEFDTGDLSGAKARYQEGLAIAKKFGNRSEIARDLGEWAKVVWAEGDWHAARRMREESLAIYRQTGEKNSIAGAIMNLAMIQLSLGELTAAQKLFLEAQQIFTNTTNQRGVAYAVFCLGQISEEEGDLTGAKTRFEEALALREKSGDQGYLTDTRLALGTVAMEEGRDTDGEAAARQAINEYRAQEDVDNEISAAAILVQALLAQKKVADAQQVIDATKPSKNTNQITRLDFNTADASVRAASGRTEEAVRLLQDTVHEARKLGFLGLQFDARLALGEAEMKSGRRSAGGAELSSLERDAKAKGFLLIARKARNTRNEH